MLRNSIRKNMKGKNAVFDEKLGYDPTNPVTALFIT